MSEMRKWYKRRKKRDEIIEKSVKYSRQSKRVEQSILKQINYFDEIKKGEKSYIEMYENIAYDIDKKRQENINL